MDELTTPSATDSTSRQARFAALLAGKREALAVLAELAAFGPQHAALGPAFEASFAERFLLALDACPDVESARGWAFGFPGIAGAGRALWAEAAGLDELDVERLTDELGTAATAAFPLLWARIAGERPMPSLAFRFSGGDGSTGITDHADLGDVRIALYIRTIANYYLAARARRRWIERVPAAAGFIALASVPCEPALGETLVHEIVHAAGISDTARGIGLEPFRPEADPAHRHLGPIVPGTSEATSHVWWTHHGPAPVAIGELPDGCTSTSIGDTPIGWRVIEEGRATLATTLLLRDHRDLVVSGTPELLWSWEPGAPAVTPSVTGFHYGAIADLLERVLDLEDLDDLWSIARADPGADASLFDAIRIGASRIAGDAAADALLEAIGSLAVRPERTSEWAALGASWATLLDRRLDAAA